MAETPKLLVSEQVVASLLNLPRRPWEIGGWLLGYWSHDRDAIVVTHATPPAARGTSFGITISGAGHRRRFDEAWQQSGGHVTFLGDWHTHPGGPAVPSGTDQRAMRQLAEDDDYRTPEPLIAIVSLPRWSRSARKPEIAFYLRCEDGEVREPRFARLSDLPDAVRGVPAWEWPRAA